MKKVFLILILFLSCYVIYNKTIDNKIYYLTIGDSISKGTNEYGTSTYGYSNFVKDYLYKTNKLKEYNKTFTSNDYQITDIVRILEYNESKDNQTLNRLIKKADIITISLGMNDLYYKINNPSKIYTYIDNMINDYNKILNYINKFHHQEVFILGYYNVTGKNNDIFKYANYNLKQLCHKYNYTYIDLSLILDNNPNYFSKNNNFIPNIKGYERISQIIVEKIKNNWYNIPCNFITMTYVMAEGEKKMKKNIHPNQKTTKFVCACGNVIEATSTREEETFPIEVCSECHPFYTGKQNLGSRKGQVEKFNKKFGFTNEK